MNKYLKTFLLVIIVAIFSKVVAEEVPLPQLVLSSDKNTVTPGEVISFEAIITGWDETKEGGVISDFISGVRLINSINFDKFDNNPPFTWIVTYPENFSGNLSYTAHFQLGKHVISSNKVDIFVKPNTSDIKNIIFTPGTNLILSSGQSERLIVESLLNNGQKIIVSHSEFGTTYSENIINGITTTSGDSPVISVSADGLVTALQPGSAEVVATNNGKTAIRRITVIAVEENDVDGDGLTDAQEDSIGTNKYHSDSDGDGSTDDIEVGSDTFLAIELAKRIAKKDKKWQLFASQFG